MDLSKLSDAELIERLKSLAKDEKAQLRVFLEHLREFRNRTLAEKGAFSSTFTYCTQELGLSEGESYRRIQAANLADRFPAVLDMIADGRLNLTAVSVLAPHLNLANFEALTQRAVGKSKRELEFLVASLAKPTSPMDLVQGIPDASVYSDRLGAPPEAPVAPSPPAMAKITVIAEDAVRVGFTASRDVFDMIERARALLRHKIPKGDLGAIMGEALEALLAAIDPDRRVRPAPERSVLAGRRRIPQWVKDSVWKRDNGRCAYSSSDGRRCAETAWLEFDHMQAYTRGGRSDDPNNIQLLCRAHNQLKGSS